MYLLDVQAPMAHQFPPEQQHRNLMAVAHFCRRVGIDIEHVDADRAGFRQRRQFEQHLIARARGGMTAEDFFLYRVVGRAGAVAVAVMPRP